MDHLSLDELREQFAKEFPSLPTNENPFNDPPVRPEPEPEPAFPKQIQRRRIRNTGIAKRSRSEIIQPKLAKKPTRPRREDEQAPSDKKATDDKATTTPDGATSSERATPSGANPGQATASSRRKFTVEEITALTDNLLGLGLDFGGSRNMSLNSTNGNYPSYLEGPPTNQGAGGGGMQRQAPSPLSQQQVNNNGGPNGVGGLLNGLGMGMPINAGQQMDLNLIFKHVNDLSEALRENREKTQGIVAGAEELATRAAASGAIPSLQEANHEISAARIADLTRQVNQLQSAKQTLLREQRENTKLIGEYETSLGTIVEQIRNFAYGKNMEKTQLSRDYNKLLQEEKDTHLATRLEKDEWHSKFMRSVVMLREAYRLRCEEEELPIRVVAGLQNEVRAYRNALGMEPEKFEEEWGYEILKDVKDTAPNA